MFTMTSKRVMNLKAKLKAAQAELTIRLRAKTHADRAYSKTVKEINEHLSKLAKTQRKVEPPF